MAGEHSESSISQKTATTAEKVPAYRGDESYVFVCHSHADAQVVYPELDWLRQQGINIWYDEGIAPGSEFPETLGRQILGASLVLCYVSGNSIASRHCRDELYFALDNDRPVLPVHLEKVELPPGLALSTATTQAIERYKLSLGNYQQKLLEGIATFATAVKPARSRIRSPAQKKFYRRAGLLLSLLVCAALIPAAVSYFSRQADLRWVEQEAFPELESMVENEWRNYDAAYALAQQIEEIVPDDPRLAEILHDISLHIAVTTDPEGVDVEVKPYSAPEADWTFIGKTPLRDVRLPISVLRWRLSKPGYTTVEAAHSSWDLNPATAEIDRMIASNDLYRKLEPVEATPPGMVLVSGTETPSGPVADFYIDRFEMTNSDYQQFVNDGGYTRPEFWQHPFIEDGRELTFTEAVSRFVDQSGRPGPSTWLGGTFEAGEGQHPVSGVSWYEAAAYAEYAGHSLPSGTHWGLARGEQSTLIRAPQLGGHALFIPFSNFDNRGTVPVGSLQGITSYGAYDLAGNVREWCFNPTASGRLVRGGAYQDNPYRFEEPAQAPAFFRTPGYGFRTVLLPEGQKPEALFTDLPITPAKHYREQDVVSDEIFEVFLRQFDYDHSDLNPEPERRSEGEFWTSETVSVDLPYTDERMNLVLFLPKHVQPPYQTVVYFPGSGSIFQGSSEDLQEYQEFTVFLSFLIRTGRAVVYPIYQGTFERSSETTTQLHVSLPTNAYTEFTIELVKDFRRSIDYLETRPDIDMDRLAYYGMSWGGLLGAIMTAVEDRIATAIFLSGGLMSEGRPEVHPLHYAPRVKIPVLMLSGQFDSILGYEFAIKPLYELLGTDEEHKTLKVYPTDHIPPKREFVPEILHWLDQYLGPVQRDE